MLIFLHLTCLWSLCLIVPALSMKTCLWCHCILGISLITSLTGILSWHNINLYFFSCGLLAHFLFSSLNIPHFIIDCKSTLHIKVFFNDSILNRCLYKNCFLTFSFALSLLSGKFSCPCFPFPVLIVSFGFQSVRQVQNGSVFVCILWFQPYWGDLQRQIFFLSVLCFLFLPRGSGVKA